MKMHFTLVLKGEDTLQKKFEESLQANPSLHMDLIRSFGQVVMLAFRLNEADGISVESFRAGKMPDEPIPEPVAPQVENKVEN